MEPKRFFAENSQMAFRLVRESLGDDAIIISNKTLPNGVEVVAGDQLLNEPVAKTPVKNPAPELEQWDLVQKNSEDLQLKNMQELVALKQLMISELAAVKVGSWESNDKERYRLFQDLVKLGFSIGLVAKITSLLDANSGYEQMRSDALQEIELSINTGEGFGQAVDELTGIVMLHGMTGAGKTTSIAKIAAQVVAVHGADEVVMVCADNKRMGAHQQLLGYGKILEVPVLQVRRSAELEEILTALKGKRLVLVDNAGITPDTLKDIANNPVLNCDIPDVKHYLTLAATTQASILNKLLKEDWSTCLHGVIVTKVDEAVQLGEFISSLIQSKLPAAFLADGQNIRTDLKRLFADDLIERAVALGKIMDDSEEESVSNAVKTLLHDKLTPVH
ncbi:MAG: hypothetical protein KTR32_43400 [Granulosicoccus sp.]|nr:hypothetical protein [Granulosicoccus sp.]